MDKLYDKIDYRILENIQILSGAVTACCFFDIAIKHDIDNLPKALIPAGVLLASSYIDKKKDSKLDTIYNEILDSYVKLNDELDFNNPVEIFTLYKTMLENGYLSSNKSFNYNYNSEVDLNGKNVIYGIGVSRHVNGYLNDIYKKKKMRSTILNTSIVDSNYMSMLPEHIIGSHVINKVEYNNELYYLDAFLDDFYEYEGGSLLGKKNSLKIAKNSLATIQRELLIKENAKVKSFYDIASKSNSIIRANKDLLEEFYLDNNDKYKELSNKILKLKK